MNENNKLGNNFYCSKICQFKAYSKQRKFICENSNCLKRFSRSPHVISLHNFCSQSCAAIVNNRLYPKRKAIIKKCANVNCDALFKKQTIYCSTRCQHLCARSYTADELVRMLKEKSKELRRTPAKREMPEIVGPVINTFGSWNAGIKNAELQPHRSDSQRMYKRRRTKARDGHQCDSVSEAIIDNWLLDHRIEHARDARYPDTGHKADWKIKGNIFVEYFGLAHDSVRYDREIKKKRKICKKSGITLIEIYPVDLYPQLRLEKKFKKFF